MPEDSRESPKRRSWLWYVLLLVPFVVLLPGLYNRMTPALAGLPYFYWCQLLWVVLCSILTGIVYLVTR